MNTSFLFNKEQLRYIRILQRCELNTFQQEFVTRLLDINKVELLDLESEYLQLMFDKYKSQIQKKLRHIELLTKL